ncbi:MAG: leucine-rich repeat protein, partial [Alistipes sp.]|nr:leucine-rich repeat protein [Alistipes sp.]
LIPDDVTSIGDRAFMGTNISSLQLPPNLREIDGCAFYTCSSLSGSLTLPETLESIGESAFYGCSMLSGTLTLPSKLTKIESGTFSGCGFTGDLVIPENIKSIGSSAFQYCKIDGYLTLSNSLTKIDDGAFGNCRFQGELVIPKEVQSIGKIAFQTNSFTNVVFEEGSELKKIGNQAFQYNYRLSEPVVLPEGLTTIGANAFDSCNTLPSVVIPSTVTTIGASAFNNCYYLTNLRCDATMPPICGSGAFHGVGKENLTLEVPEESVPLYQTATGWADFNRISAHYDFSIARKHIRTLNAAYSKSYLLRVPSGEAWEIKSKPEWVTVTPASGVGRTEVTISVSEMPRTSDTFTFEVMGTYGNWTSETHKGRAGEIIFKLTNKVNAEGGEIAVKMDVQQYDSDNYDGQVIANQTATKGAGVNIVFMGDCFDARDIATGSYLDGIDEAIGYYFAIEPYKSYKEYFNVYTVVGMSTDSGMGTVNLVKEAKFGSQYSLDGIEPDTEITYEYAMKAPTVDAGNLNETLVVMVENTEDYGGICYMWGDGSAIAICPMSRDAYPFDFRGIVQHEAGGHGFAKLADEYIYHNAFIQSCSCPCCSHLDAFYAGKALGWYRNLSTNGDHHTVEWAHLFAHPDYTNMVDMYEGGYFHSRGIYRSEANSCMNNNVPYYSAIQRQEMVERIKRYAGEEFQIEEFYANDVRDASNNDFVARSLVEKESAAQAAAAKKQLPPKFMGDSPLLR